MSLEIGFTVARKVPFVLLLLAAVIISLPIIGTHFEITDYACGVSQFLNFKRI